MVFGALLARGGDEQYGVSSGCRERWLLLL